MIKFDARVGKDKKYWDRQGGGKYKRYWRLDASLSDIIAGNVDADRTVLEVAAGTGLIALELAGRVVQIYGVDIAAAMVDEANQSAREKGIENAKFLVRDACCLSLDDNMFDVVICVSALYFIREPSRALPEMKRVLKQRGCLVAATPCIGDSVRLRIGEIENRDEVVQGLHGAVYLSQFRD